MKIFVNESECKLLRIIFADKDVLHLLPGERLSISDHYPVIKVSYV